MSAVDLFSFFYQFADVFAFLILSASGLAIVFGMMGIINMAHGEFIMCGAYVTVGLVNLGVPLPLAQIAAAITAGLVGVVVEILVVRKFYKRPLDSLLATWGLSLIVTQGMLIVVGSSIRGIGTPEGSFVVGDYTNIRKFLYDVETAEEFVIIEEVGLSQLENVRGGDLLELELKLATYFLPRTPAGALTK